jgi:Protein of unknown function (DUF3723)
MWRTQTHEEELRLEGEKRVKYKGTARIGLEWLHFQRNEPSEPDDKNIERLKSIFKNDCRRLELRNHIPAIIDQQDLDVALLDSRILSAELLSTPQDGYPELVFPAGYRLECLHGRQRIQAAKRALLLGDKWWTVDLYLAGMGDFSNYLVYS